MITVSYKGGYYDMYLVIGRLAGFEGVSLLYDSEPARVALTVPLNYLLMSTSSVLKLQW